MNFSVDISSLGSDPLKWPKSVIVVAVILLCAAVFVADYMFFIGPALSKRSAMQFEEESLKNEYSTRKAGVANLEGYKKYYEYLMSSFGELVKQFPKGSQVNELLRSINQLGVSNNMIFCSFLPQKKVEKDLYVESPVAIEMAGSYNDFGNFVYQVAQLDKVIVLSDISISTASIIGSGRGGNAGGSCGVAMQSLKPSDLIFSFNANTYQMLDKENKSAVTKNGSGLSANSYGPPKF